MAALVDRVKNHNLGPNGSRNASATYVIPTENEWYKAANYDPTLGGGSGGYWNYPTKSNSVPGNILSAAGTNNAKFSTSDYTDPTNELTPVGAFADPRAYGTCDQGGDVWQCNEAMIASSRGLRGGAWDNVSGYVASSGRNYYYPAYEGYRDIGFRVASLAVPEPGSIALVIAGWLCLAAYSCRSRPAHVETPFRTCVKSITSLSCGLNPQIVRQGHVDPQYAD